MSMDIFEAIRTNNIEELKKILQTERLKDLEDGFFYEESPVLEACFVGSLEMMDLFLKKGIDVNGKHGSDGRSLLSVAAQRGDCDMLEFLLENGAGASVNAIDWKGRTALFYAVKKRFFKIEWILKLLMEENKQR